ncbi:type VI secretion system tube protein TssD [Cellulophaga baltica]|uniref:type VI secretion system tube protein TssD n=1 Tax=Cellulophaga baltica TaxID=76594 RepID=UPI000411A0D6|nr:type VI secretion system tube protein TssD [Cellulophaga baltica]
MAFLAKLFINGEQRNVLNGNYVYHQLLDARGKPKAKVEGGQLNFVVESTGDDALFHLWMLDDYQMYDGYIRFFKRDGLSKLFDFEFANCYCVGLREQFSATGHDPLKMELTITPGIQRVRDVIFEKVWNPSNPFAEAPVVVEQEDTNLKILNSYFENTEGDKITKIRKGQDIVLVVKTQNMIGEQVNIDLGIERLNFMYNGQELENNIIESCDITSNLMRVDLISFVKKE